MGHAGGHFRKPGEKFGVAVKEIDEEENNVYDPSNQNIAVGSESGFFEENLADGKTPV